MTPKYKVGQTLAFKDRPEFRFEIKEVKTFGNSNQIGYELVPLFEGFPAATARHFESELDREFVLVEGGENAGAS